MTTKRKILYLLGLVAMVPLTLFAQRATKVYFDYGGDKLIVASGGELEVQSGGTVDMQSGATIGATAATITTLTATTGTITNLTATTGTIATVAHATSIGVDAAGGTDEVTITDDKVAVSDEALFYTATASAPPAACAAGTAGALYYDTDVNELCVCNATNWLKISDMSTGCS